MNVAKIKGSHTAMKSGMVAAESVFSALNKEGTGSPIVLNEYEDSLKESWVWKELHKVRNVRPGFAKLGLYAGSIHAGFDSLILRGNAPWTLKHPHPDYELKPAAEWFALLLFLF